MAVGNINCLWIAFSLINNSEFLLMKIIIIVIIVMETMIRNVIKADFFSASHSGRRNRLQNYRGTYLTQPLVPPAFFKQKMGLNYFGWIKSKVFRAKWEIVYQNQSRAIKFD